MLKKLIPIMMIIIVQCGNGQKIENFGKSFFALIDQGKYDLAFNMLSEEDKKNSNVEDFSLKLQELKDSYYYPDKMDSSVNYSVTKLPDSLFKEIMNSKMPLPTGINEIYIFKELSRIPDINTISKSSDDDDYEKREKEILQKLIDGNYPTVVDSGRFVLIVIQNNKPYIYSGAKYWNTRDKLAEMYATHLKSNLSITTSGKAQIYRTTGYGVVGCINVEIKNNSRDTLSIFALKVKAKINDISTDKTLINSKNTEIPPKSILKEKVIISDDYLQSLLGYSRDELWSKGEVEISSYPTTGKGLDYDSIFSMQPNTFFNQFSMPIKQGVLKLFIGL